ncbi:UDP-N-acetylmuramoyl-L-alanyl-D-glutamate--2, 6-diaminopimelate ligase [Alphaproteobacteria bacterium SO-S41]|nr:UDP-N-acetylmuramoyl-L-alanyl-D-glutamate--2, 6-diaminopimelate ligase [Alphaproteobacteria bacterium SO-S41]
MKLSALIDGWQGAGDPEIAGLTADSRAVKPGFLFAALPGVKADGRTFIPKAIDAGAAAVIAVPGTDAAVPVVANDNPRKAFSLAAARFYGRQPAVVAAITGTNGKTSIAAFVRQIFTACGRQAASIGTVGIVSPSGERALSHTTPDPVVVHEALARLADEGVTHLALEASSHGLDQYRLDGVKIAAAAFTNLTRDHLDYHETFDAYRDAKLRLFIEVVEADGVAVIDADGDGAEDFVAASRRRGLRVHTVGEQGEMLRLVAREAHIDGQVLTVAHGGIRYIVRLPLAGSFQASNALVAAGIAIGLGESPSQVFSALAALKGAKGRLEHVATSQAGAPIFVDYAHTPDALETVLQTMRPHVQGKLVVVFGCGGDRDPGKRPLMGAAAAANADVVIVTDDNPRTEDPALIRAAALTGAPGAREIGDRAEAIDVAVAALAEGDILVIAGKGHEAGQTIGTVTLPFDDGDEARRAAVSHGGRSL